MAAAAYEMPDLQVHKKDLYCLTLMWHAQGKSSCPLAGQSAAQLAQLASLPRFVPDLMQCGAQAALPASAPRA
jgi:hypothetical protein